MTLVELKDKMVEDLRGRVTARIEFIKDAGGEVPEIFQNPPEAREPWARALDGISNESDQPEDRLVMAGFRVACAREDHHEMAAWWDDVVEAAYVIGRFDEATGY